MKTPLIVNLLLMTVATALIAAEPSAGEGAALMDGVAAYVNGEIITLSDVMTEVRRNPLPEVPRQELENKLRELYKATLEAQIDRKLILNAVRKSKMEMPSWTVDNRIREIVADHFEGDQTKLHTLLAERQINYDQWRQTIEEELLISGMRYQHVERRANPTPSEIRAEFDNNRARYQLETAVGVSLIVLSAPPQDGPSVEERANTIYAELKKGGSFASLAKTYSSDAKAEQGGSWGKVNPESVFRKELVDALAKIKPGEVAPLLMLDGDGYIVRKEDQQDGRPLTFEEAAPYVTGHLRMRHAERLHKEWIERLRSEAYIKIFDLPLAK